MSSKITLSPGTVIGTTATSANGFVCLPNSDRYAACVGSAAVVGHVDQNFNIRQKIFRATPEPASLPSTGFNEPSTAPSTPEFRSRPKASFGYPASASRASPRPRIEAASSPGKGILRTRTKSVTCVSLSPDGRILAVGETGFAPRILLFAVSDDEPDVPFAVLSEHSTGVRCLRFSGDGRWLCSVGDIHDGTILLWSVGLPRSSVTKLHARNKCNSFIHDLAWVGNDFVVTAGTRHVKIWRLDLMSQPQSPSKSKWKSEPMESPATPRSSTKALAGRNILLGPLLDSCFTSIVALDATKAVVATDRGEVCLLDTGLASQSLLVLRVFEGGVTSLVATGPYTVWVGTSGVRGGKIHRLRLDEERASGDFQERRSVDGVRLLKDPESALGPLALGTMYGRVFALDSERIMQIFDSTGDMIELTTKPQRKFWCHRGPVMGVCPATDSGFITWDTTGLVMRWALPDAEHLGSYHVKLERPAEPGESNELRVLKFVGTPEDQVDSGKANGVQTPGDERSMVVCGDKYGIMKILNHLWEELISTKAHSGSINDICIAVSASPTVIASAGRDRMIQIFQAIPKEHSLNLLQTLDCHASSVQSVLFHDNNRTLISASSDRTIAISTLATNKDDVAFVPVRVITLKQSPMGMALDTEKPGSLLVSTVHQIQRYDINDTCQPVNAVRLSDGSSGTVVMNTINHVTIGSGDGRREVIVGASANDRSIRVHCAESGLTLGKEFGHADGIGGVRVFGGQNPESHLTVVSTGLDGTVMLWNLAQEKVQTPDDTDSPVSYGKIHTLPLRRVLSRTMLSEFSKSLETEDRSPTGSASIRLRSPTRLRKKRSEYSLMGSNAKHNFPIGNFSANRSPSPERIPRDQRGGSRPSLSMKHRAHSIEDLRNTALSAEQLSRALRRFRRYLAQSKPRDEKLKELELELYLTQEHVNKRTEREHSGSSGRR